MAKNIYFLAGYPFHWIFSFPVPYPLRYAGALFGTVFWVLILRGLRKAPARFLVAKLFVVAYVGMLVLYIWPPDRFMLPLLPILLLFGYFALPVCTPSWVLPALAVLPMMFAVWSTVSTVDRRVAAIPRTSWTSDPEVEWDKISQVQNWVRDHTSGEAVVIANYDPAFYLYSGHKSVRPYYVSGADLFYGLRLTLPFKISECLAVIRKYQARYLVETGHDDVEDPTYTSLLEYFTSTGRLRLLKQIAPHYRIFEIVPDRAAHT